MKKPEKKSADTPAESNKPTKIIKKRNTFNETDLDIISTPLDPEEPFSLEYMLSETIWYSNTQNAISQQFLLSEFSYNDKQTLALKLTIPNNSNSWSINICPAKDYHNNNIFLHFNPRYNKKHLIMNDKQGTWGEGKKKTFTDIHTSKNNGILAKEIDLIIQIRPDGFYIFANNIFNSFFYHRRDPTTTSINNSSNSSSNRFDDEYDVSKKCTDLKLIVNARDANGKVNDVILNKVRIALYCMSNVQFDYCTQVSSVLLALIWLCGLYVCMYIYMRHTTYYTIYYIILFPIITTIATTTILI